MAYREVALGNAVKNPLKFFIAEPSNRSSVRRCRAQFLAVELGKRWPFMLLPKASALGNHRCTFCHEATPTNTPRRKLNHTVKA